MASYSVAEAKNTLPRLIKQALAGEKVVITRHGKPAVSLAVEYPQIPDLPIRTRQQWNLWLVERRNAMPKLGISSAELLRLEDEESAH